MKTFKSQLAKVSFAALASCFTFASLAVAADAPGACSQSCNFNRAPIAGGTTIWFNSSLNQLRLGPNELKTPLTIYLTGVTITFTANGTPYTVSAPNASVTYDPGATAATTTFTAGTPGMWSTTLPTKRLASNSFLDAVAFPVPAGGLPGGIEHVTWQGTFSNSSSSAVDWQWAAAVYTQFSANYNALGVKPVDDGEVSRYQNSDHAGTPEGFKAYVTRGGTGDGGSNHCGYSSATAHCDKCGSAEPAAMAAACVPLSSIAVTVGANVNAYVPFGSWMTAINGVAEVPLEGNSTATTFVTPGVVNSCAANSMTGEVVCTENTNNIDVINGSTLTTITSGAETWVTYSGGTCENCGVAINAANNTAAITMGNSSGASGTGIQILNLANNSLNTPFGLANMASEGVSVDPTRNLILSASYGATLTAGGVYDLLQVGSDNSLTEYGNSVGGALDSAAEDCSTGIALSSDEFSDNIYITDLTQAEFTAGSPGTWTAPGQFINLNDGGYGASGTASIVSAPGPNHLALVGGEFGDSAYTALQLPAASGSGIPALVDYAYVSKMPNCPNGGVFETGFDPHKVTAYTSPTTGKSYAVIADYQIVDDAPEYYVGVIDLACVLALPRTSGTHTVVGNASTCTRYVVVPAPAVAASTTTATP
jgi:hypothetical protein